MKQHLEGIGFWPAIWYLILGSIGVLIFELLLEITSNYISGDYEPEPEEQESSDEIEEKDYYDLELEQV